MRYFFGFLIFVIPFIYSKNETNQTFNETLDIFQKEILVLEETISLYTKKIETLQKMRNTYLKFNKTILNAPNSLLINEKKIEEKTNIYKRNEHYDEYIQNKKNAFQPINFMNRVFLKFNIQLNARIKEFQFLSTRQYRSGNDLTGYFIFVILTSDSNILLYDISGKYIQEYNPGHIVKFISTGPHTDEYTFSTLGYDETIKTHLLEYKRIKVLDGNNETDKRKEKYTYSFEVREENSFELKSKSEGLDSINLLNENKYTNYITYMIKGLKYHIISDNQGNLIVYHKNGTFKGQINFESNPIIVLHKHYPTILVASLKNIAFFNPASMTFSPTNCDSPAEEILNLVLDTSNNNIFYVLLNNLEILVYETKSSQSLCKVIYKLNSAYGKSKQKYSSYKLHATKNFLLLQDEFSSILKVFNVTEMGYEDQSEQEGFDLTIKEHELDNKLIYYFQKNNLYSTYMGLIETGNQFDNSSFSLFELSAPQKPQNEFFSNMRFPIILLSIVFAIGYQIWNRKKGNKDNSNDFDKLEGLKNTIDKISKNPNLGSSFLDKNLSDSKNSFDNINKRTMELNESLKNLKNSGIKSRDEEKKNYEQYDVNDIDENEINYFKKKGI